MRYLLDTNIVADVVSKNLEQSPPVKHQPAAQ